MIYIASSSAFIHTLAVITIAALMIPLPGVCQADAQQPRTIQTSAGPVEVLMLDKGLNLIGWPGVTTTSALLLDTHPLINEIWWLDPTTKQWVVDSRTLPDDLRTNIKIGRGSAIGVFTSEVSQLRIPLPGLSVSPIYLNQADDGIHIAVTVGNSIEVRLYGNPTTGFDWEVDDAIDSVLIQDGEKRVEFESGLSGAGATFTFRFIAIKPGEVTLRLIYRRPFEEGIDPLFTFETSVTVGGLSS